MSAHDYKGHTIRVDTLDGARPWAVYVDGVLVFGRGERVRRRLAFTSAQNALKAGKATVNKMLRAQQRAEQKLIEGGL